MIQCSCSRQPRPTKRRRAPEVAIWSTTAKPSSGVQASLPRRRSLLDMEDPGQGRTRTDKEAPGAEAPPGAASTLAFNGNGGG